MSERWVNYVGDCRKHLARVRPKSVQMCLTSPPYFGMRDYGMAAQLGLEKTPAKFINNLVEVFFAVHRALKDDGTLWLNLGDSYCNAGSRNNGAGLDGARRGGMQSTDGTWRDAKAKFGDRRHSLIAEGIKHKDLIGIPWRVAFALQRAGWYLRADIVWDRPNAMPEKVSDRPTKAHEYVFLLTKSPQYFYDAPGVRVSGENRNLRSVWRINTSTYRGAHFATFPVELAQRCIRAGSHEGDTVMDPFSGVCTTGIAALLLGRNFLGMELNPDYAKLAEQRRQDAHRAIRANDKRRALGIAV